jgi:hypothetical protein
VPIGLTLVQAPAGEPVTLAEAKAWLRVDFADDDGLVADTVRAARMYVEQRCDRQFVSATLKLTADRFPRYSSLGGLQYQSDALWDQRVPVTELASRYWPDRSAMRLPRPPLQAVTGIVYVAQDGTTPTLDPAIYTVDPTTEPGRVVPAFGQIWPITRQQPQAVAVTYVAGYGPVTTIAGAVAAGVQTVTPAAMYGIYPGTTLAIDTGTARELVVVSAVTATTFTAPFAQTHAAGVAVGPGVPEQARQAMKLLVNHWYEHREAVGMALGGPVGEPVALAVESLLGQVWDGEYV